MALKPPHDTYVRTAAELTQLWTDMMGPGGFAMRSLWHVYFAEDGQLQPVVVPIDDLPDAPDDHLVGNLAESMRVVLPDTDAESLAVLLSRPGPGHMTLSDRRWARAISAAYGPRLCPWPMHLATTDRIQVFAPDDLIAA